MKMTKRVVILVAYSNSPLVIYKKLSPNHSGLRTHIIDTISIHCMAGNLSVETCGAVFAPTSRGASSNYGIDSKGRIGMYVEEKNRSWCTSSASNDHRAITIEVANDSAGPLWHVSAAAMTSLIELCADICKRNSIKELRWVGDKNLIGRVDLQNMTVHKWFAAKACPGNYLFEKHGYIASEVNKRIKGVENTMTEAELKSFIEKTVREMGANQPASTWAAPLVEEAKSMGITDGSNPQGLATRQEVAIMAMRAAQIKQ